MEAEKKIVGLALNSDRDYLKLSYVPAASIQGNNAFCSFSNLKTLVFNAVFETASRAALVRGCNSSYAPAT